MVGARRTPRTSAVKSESKESPRSSPRSVKSARSARSTRTPKATPPKSVASRAKPRTSLQSQPDKKRAKKETDLDSATGLTETESESSVDEASEDAFDPSSAEEDDEPIASDSEESVDSDFLDEETPKRRAGTKRKSTGGGGGSGKKGSATKLPPGGIEGFEDEDEEELDIELEDGQEIAGKIFAAPTTGQVPPGRISKNTLNFLKNLQIPERNDRDWFRAHEPAFRQAEKEWQAFVGKLQVRLHEADSEVPILPPKDVIHRIYRDVRFSSDKTPYKRNFSMSTSRGGRKGVWAAYHLSISPNDNSLLASGIWCPNKNETATFRQNVVRRAKDFRAVIGEPEFVKLFGEPEPHKNGGRQNIFGHDDMLKVKPKDFDKDHKEIDLLKLRSVAVVHKFSDEEVLDEGFAEKVKQVAKVMMPFVHTLNEFITIPNGTNGANGDDDDEDDNANGADEDDD